MFQINTLLFVFMLITLLVIVDARPCAKCLTETQFCGSGSGGECLGGTKCVSLEHDTDRVCSGGQNPYTDACVNLDGGAAFFCAPTVQPYAECGDYAYDPCPASHYCDPDTLTCELIPGTAGINDGCKNDEDCRSPFLAVVNCTNEVCTSESSCTIIGCPIHQKCSNDNDPLVFECVAKGRANAQCDSSADCYLSSCIGDVCREWFTLVEGADCDTTRDCKPGLECYQKSTDTEDKCHEPMLKYITVNDLHKWGANCDGEVMNVGDGCICNPNSQQEQFLVESNPTYREVCKEKTTKFYDCLATNNCYEQNLEEHACMRKYCNNERLEKENFCEYFGYNVPRCSASTYLYAIILLIAIILLH